MGIHPKKHNRESFLHFLKKNKVSEKIINDFFKLPESIINNNIKYDLYIQSTWYGEGNTHYTFELNYYSEEVLEYLFNIKIINNVEVSINYLLCELINNNYINFDENCKL